MSAGTRFNTASGLDTSFGSDTLAIMQTEDLANQGQVYTIVPLTTGTPAITAAQMQNAIWSVSGGSTCAPTFPTPAALVAATVNAQVGLAFEVIVQNNNSSTFTIPASGTPTGYTLVGTATAATTLTQRLLVILTNVTLGSETYSVYACSKVAT